MLQRLLWKLLPKNQRAFLLGRLSVVDRQAVNKSLSAVITLPTSFVTHKCVFIHVPKCGGSSLCSAFLDGRWPGHLPYYWYQQQFPEHCARSFKFAFVRDPLERAYSAYAYLRGNNMSRRDQEAQALVTSYRDFDDFVAQWLHPDNLRRQLHFAPQTDFLVDHLGRMSMDFLGRHEHFERDFRHLCERLAVDTLLPHLNVSLERRNEPVREFCSLRTRRLVRRAYQRDYEVLGYE
ncbi:sulfotransferase family 2 domain-containing protein [Pseudomonas sp. 3MA1]|uniref:sulfotransferase family 2 domain-containing protein n=1 Tax=Pseudomonas sp. 3MA1 TaxID=2699196 RepID=UPI0005B62258|nr:sulfotransferase family 2 domain-containing protein [Pseudomonas sp. 3MA1]MDF2396559.1 sulfotransferase family 2 domain-containing protein [Pseudomonas sp. 3MA1]